MKYQISGYRMYPNIKSFIHDSSYFYIIYLSFSSFLVAVQECLPEDDTEENTLANNQVLYPICVRCLEKFENDPEQIHKKDFAEICLQIVSIPFEL